MSDSLARSGLYFDELNRIRILDPNLSNKTNELNFESNQFIEKTSHFKRIVENFVDVIDKIAQNVEKEKIKALGSRNLLKSIEKQKESDYQQLQALVKEKKQELERLREEYDSLRKEEAEQLDQIGHLLNQK